MNTELLYNFFKEDPHAFDKLLVNCAQKASWICDFSPDTLRKDPGIYKDALSVAREILPSSPLSIDQMLRTAFGLTNSAMLRETLLEAEREITKLRLELDEALGHDQW